MLHLHPRGIAMALNRRDCLRWTVALAAAAALPAEPTVLRAQAAGGRLKVGIIGAGKIGGLAGQAGDAVGPGRPSQRGAPSGWPKPAPRVRNTYGGQQQVNNEIRTLLLATPFDPA